jgi:hypothetical protein
LKYAASAALFAAIAGLAACGGDSSVSAPVPVVASASNASPEEAALREITRAVALALQDPGMRARVKNDMRNAPFVEHKLHFRGYLQGQSGGSLLSRVAEVTGRSRAEVLALLDQVRPMEFYMPVSAQRESWEGGDDLLVAGAPNGDEGTVFGYNLRGEPVVLSTTEAPATPTLVITQAETDFSKPIDIPKFVNANDRGGRALGNYLPRAASAAGSLGPRLNTYAGMVQRRGVSVEEFISHFSSNNDHEAWFAGNAEFRLLLAGRQADGMEYRGDKRVPEWVWDKSGTWKDMGSNDLSLATWDRDLGNRIQVKCIEEDYGTVAEITVTGTTQFLSGESAQIAVKFKISDDDDNCDTVYIDIRNTNGEWYWIPDGVNDDLYNPAPPYFNGVSSLKWYGYGLERI